MSESVDAARDGQNVPEESATEVKNWREVVRRYQTPCLRRAWWQIINSIGPYLLLWGLLYVTRGQAWWLTGLLAVLAGLFLVRIFIIFHDCGHGSFFRSKRANDILGIITGILTLTPYHHWRWGHAVHHAGAGHLERRGMGDIWTLTVDEYNAAPRWKRLAYRFVRHPLVLVGILPTALFVIGHRIPDPQASRRDRASVHWTNLAVLAMAAGLSLLFGLVPYLLIQLTIIMVGGGLGVWLFYVQHQFEDVYWESGDNWDFASAALEGSSYYKLPKVLQWFTGNIGFHHIHHLSSRIPNYHLERAHEAEPLFHSVKPITLWSSLKTLRLRLWDKEGRKLVGFRQARKKGEQQRNSGLAS